MSRASRQGVRLKTHFETLYCSDRQEGEAVLANVSYSGALLESATRPAMGSRVMLYVCLPDGVEPLKLRGKVVRHTSDGFALYYDKPNPDVVRFVDDEAAIASVLREDVGGSSPIVDVLESPGARNLEGAAGLVEEMVVGVLVEDVPVADVPMAEVPTVAEVPMGAPMLLSDLDLSCYTICEIEALAQRIPKVIANKRVEAKQRVLQKIKKLADQEGFSLEELLEKS